MGQGSDSSGSSESRESSGRATRRLKSGIDMDEWMDGWVDGAGGGMDGSVGWIIGRIAFA